jgi:hypothetical protein
LAGQDPVGTLECPEGFILNHLGLCSPENPTDQATLYEVFVPSEKNKNRVSAAALLEEIKLKRG